MSKNNVKKLAVAGMLCVIAVAGVVCLVRALG